MGNIATFDIKKITSIDRITIDRKVLSIDSSDFWGIVDLKTLQNVEKHHWMADGPKVIDSYAEREAISYVTDLWEKDGMTIYVLRNGEHKAVGYIAGRPNPEENLTQRKNVFGIFDLFIMENYRKRGLSKRALGSVYKFARDQDFHEIQAFVPYLDRSGMDFFDRIGFVELYGTLRKERDGRLKPEF